MNLLPPSSTDRLWRANEIAHRAKVTIEYALARIDETEESHSGPESPPSGEGCPCCLCRGEVEGVEKLLMDLPKRTAFIGFQDYLRIFHSSPEESDMEDERKEVQEFLRKKKTLLHIYSDATVHGIFFKSSVWKRKGVAKDKETGNEKTVGTFFETIVRGRLSYAYLL